MQGNFSCSVTSLGLHTKNYKPVCGWQLSVLELKECDESHQPPALELW